MKVDPTNLIVCGVGGQGNILIARLLGHVFSNNGYYVNIGETFGAAQRGGSVFSCLRISKTKEHGPLIPRGRGHIILGLEPLETLRMLSQYGNSDIVVIANDQEIFTVDVLAGQDHYPNKEELLNAIKLASRMAWIIPATRIAIDLNAPIVTNIVMIGALVGSLALPLKSDEIIDQIKVTVPANQIKLNVEAFKRGRLNVTN
jgi:indolepyruvate ferredoxin oxidoreductase, beta subunit